MRSNLALIHSARRSLCPVAAGILFTVCTIHPAAFSRLKSEQEAEDVGGQSGKQMAQQQATPLDQLPLSFEENRGQAGADVKFVARGPGLVMLLTGDGAVIRSRSCARPTDGRAGLMNRPAPLSQRRLPAALARLNWNDLQAEPASSASTVRLTLMGINPAATISGSDRLPGAANYIKGRDSSQWVTGVPLYSQVVYRSVYPGVDLVFHGRRTLPEYDFRLEPGADPSVIRLKFDGVTGLSIDRAGNLVGRTAAGLFIHRAPVLYDQAGQPVGSVRLRYRIQGDSQVSFDLSGYDPARGLIIDPVLDFGTYLGGNFGNDLPLSTAIDSSGFVYVAGVTESINFPVTKHGFQTDVPGGDTDGFVAKLDPTLSRLIYSTYLGGTGNEDCNTIAIDSEGNACVAGDTNSTDFPVSAGCFQTAQAGVLNGFVTKLNANGSGLIYSTYLGGSGTDSCSALAVGGAGSVYVVGFTRSTDFPITSGSFQSVLAGTQNAFAARLTSTGTVAYSTYLGGSLWDSANSIVVDSGGGVYMTGLTFSTDFPTTPNSFQPTRSIGGLVSDVEAFISKLDPTGSKLVYSTYLAGTFSGLSIAVDRQGSAYVCGTTEFFNLPVTPNAAQSLPSSFFSGFVAKLSPDGSSLVYATYLGGGIPGDTPFSIAVDKNGNAFVTGPTASYDFPATPKALQSVPSASGVVVSGDGGANWAALDKGLLANTVEGVALDPASPSTVYLATDELGLVKSTDGGADWLYPADFNLRFLFFSIALDPVESSTLYLGAIGGVVKSTDGGTTATLLTNGLPQTAIFFALAVDPRNPATVYGGSSGIFRSTDAGGSWSATNSGLTESFLARGVAIDPVTTSTVYAAGGGSIFKSSDSGDNWVSVGKDTLQAGDLRSIVIDPVEPSTVYAAGFGDGVWKSTDAGNTWSPSVQGLSILLDYTITIDPSNHHTLYAGTRNGVAKSTDAGATWNQVGTTLTSVRTFAVAVDPANSQKVYAGCETTTDGFVVELNRNGTGFVYASYIGGGSLDRPTSIAIGGAHALYITGTTDSFNFPVTSGGFESGDPNLGAGFSGFVLKLSLPPNPSIESVSIARGKLIVTGENFDSGSVILVNGARQKTQSSAQDPSHVLMSRGALAAIGPGQAVTITVHKSDGAVSGGFTFTSGAHLLFHQSA